LPQQRRLKILVAGAGGSIGSAVSRALAKQYEVVALVGSHEQLQEREPAPFLSWRACEPFSRRDVEKVITGCDYLIYLVHTRVPTARMDQAECEDMDLLIADNFARSANRQGVKQIIYLCGIIQGGNISSELLERRNEVAEALSIYGTPLTVLRAGLVVAPGSNAVRLLANIATRLPIVLIPQWADKRQQPIALPDVIRAISYCLTNHETRNNNYDIGGPMVLTYREILQAAADILKKKQTIVTVPFLPTRLYGWYLRLLDRHAHPVLVERAVEYFGHDSVVRSNPVQDSIAKNAILPREVIEPYIKRWAQLPPNPRQPFIKKYIIGLRSKSNVRSIQRIVLPPDCNATWIAETYFQWLPRFTRLLVICEVDATGSCRYYSRFPRLHLLSLIFQQEHSSPDRRMYFITEGLLAKGADGLNPRLEFRDVLNGRYTIVALHDFIPVLPWGLYFVTQAFMHLIVMRNFQKYIAKVASGLSQKTTAKTD
jgi:nucleoside-diphosphate-sugar epimerase